MLVIMTDQQQHTLLTRLVQVAPGDSGLNLKIQNILADVDKVLPTATFLLTGEHPDTLGTRNNLAHWQKQVSGDAGP